MQHLVEIKYKSTISSNHMSTLNESGISPHLANKLGWRSASSAELRKILGRQDITCGGLVIPYPGFDGFCRVRLDEKLNDAKYLQAAGSTVHLFIPDTIFEVLKVALADPKAQLLVTEGEKKAVCACAQGLPCIGLPGIWGWRNREGLLPDWDRIGIEGRKFVLIGDSDLAGRAADDNAGKALPHLAKTLLEKGADEVRILILPGPQYNEPFPKTGLDDYLVSKGKDKLLKLMQEAPVSRQNVLPPPISGAELLAQDVPPIDWVLPGLPAEYVGMLTGPDGVGKSTLVLQIALAATAGVWPWNNGANKIEPENVLYITGEEDSKEITRRLQAIVNNPNYAHLKEQAWRFNVINLNGQPWHLMRRAQYGNAEKIEENIKSIHARIDETQARLVIVDPLVMFHELTENDNGQMDRLVRLFGTIASKHNCGVLLIHHVGQNAILHGRDDHQAGRGATAIAAATRFVWTLRPMRDKEAEEWEMTDAERAMWRLWKGPKVSYGPEQQGVWLRVAENGVLVPGDPKLEQIRKGDAKSGGEENGKNEGNGKNGASRQKA